MRLDYDSALAALERRREAKMALGLERIRRVLSRLGDPQDRVPSILVAGTNGKGSVCALLEAALRASGRRTGLTVSPHLMSPRERIRVDGRAASPADFAQAVSAVLPAEDPRDPLTYFELVTAAAFWSFARRGVEAAVLEVGLGGRLDAVNAVSRPELSLITSIGYDHQALLGTTLTSIAREKAGILRPEGEALCGAVPPEAHDSLEREAEYRGAKLRFVGGRGPFRPSRTDWKRGMQQLQGPDGPWSLALLGAHQAANASLVWHALRALEKRGLKVSEDALRQAMAEVEWPGRLSLVRDHRERLWLLDGGHNAEAARAFADTWSRSPWKGEGRFVLGLLKDKDPDAFLAPLAPYLKDVALCPPPSPRALDPRILAERLRRAAPRARWRVFPDAKRALAGLRPGPGAGVVSGSFYLVAAAWKILGARPARLDALETAS